ncbi:hypothetical protein [Sphingomonas sp. 22R3R2A-7]|uniref:hypothetical protein n=1 Tax=Sphingomonas sp. 22R3R2A-7 TaxID=3050230 RepID=UPI002FE4076B
MPPLFSASSNAHCIDCTPNGSYQRIVVALVVLGLTAAAVLLWRSLLDHTGDGLIAAMLVALAVVIPLASAAKLFRF